MSRRTGQTGKHSPKRTVAPEEVQATLLQLLSEIAPDADLTGLRPTDSLPERLEIDSIDLEHFLLAVEQRMQIEIPRSDYSRFMTLAGCVQYLTSNLSISA